MRSSLAFLSAVVVAALTGGPSVAADLAKHPKQSSSVYSAGAWPRDVGRNCREWTNGCRVCVRADNKELSCSTAGMACLPGVERCTRK